MSEKKDPKGKLLEVKLSEQLQQFLLGVINSKSFDVLYNDGFKNCIPVANTVNQMSFFLKNPKKDNIYKIPEALFTNIIFIVDRKGLEHIKEGGVTSDLAAVKIMKQVTDLLDEQVKDFDAILQRVKDKGAKLRQEAKK